MTQPSANLSLRGLARFISHRFGSKQGLLRFGTYELLRLVGGYRLCRRVNFAKVKRLVFVCQGNICRSPLGEAVARQHGVTAISFGLNTRGGDCADPRAVAWGHQQGFHLAQHVTTRLEQYKPQEGDLLIGMEPKHLRALRLQFAKAPVQITLLGLWLEPPLIYLHDPYNTKAEYFSRCEALVRDGTLNIIQRCLAQRH